MEKPKFARSTTSINREFTGRVNDYFKEKDLLRVGNSKVYFKAGILVAAYIILYIHLVFFTPLYWVAIPECVLLGILTASIGFNLMHDGAHGSFSKSATLNRVAALSLDFLGASSFMWNTKHNVLHHAYTNIDGVDDDIDAKPFLRLAKTQKYYKIYRYQYIYFWGLYSFLYLFWVFFTDYKKYFSHKIGTVRLPKLKMKDHITFWGFKVLYIFLFIGLPMYMWGFLPWLTGFLIFAGIAGLLLSMVFQLAHTVNETSFPMPIQPANKLEDEWMVHELKTTADFATKNKFITWWLGGLNFQIEHHLFSKISHIHYPAICKIVRQTCFDLGLPYIEHPKLSLAIKSHIIYLKRLGRE